MVWMTGKVQQYENKNKDKVHNVGEPFKGESVELLKWLYEKEEHTNDVNNAVENFLQKYEGQKGVDNE